MSEMGARRRSVSERSQAPGSTLEARENQLILLATNLAEKQLREGSASSQVITHYLKLGTTRERLEQERLKQENELAKAKTEKYHSDSHADELYQEALNAFRSYTGSASNDDDYDDYDDYD